MPSKKLDFKAGQYVVYPTQGVGKLLRIEEQTIAGQKIKLLVIDFERNHMTLRVPLERAEISGLRPLSTAKKMDEAIASAKGKAGAKRMIWARRAAQYEENINSGDPMKLAEVVRDLQRRSASDTMTFSARQLYLRALERMAQEFAVLHKIDLDEASDKIEFLPRFGLRLFVPTSFDSVDYFGYGPYESYIDKHQASYIGNFTANVSEMYEDYTRPQENSSHYGCKYMCLTDGNVKVRFEGGKDFSFNVSEYTQEELAEKRHNFELDKCESNVVCVDYKMAGVGSNSCGPALAEKYRVPLPSFTAELKIRVF